MKKMLKRLTAAVSAAAIALSMSVTGFAASGGTKRDKLEKKLMERVYSCLYGMNGEAEDLRVSQPFAIYTEDGAVEDNYLFFVFDGDKTAALLRLYDGSSFGYSKYEAVDEAYAFGDKVGFIYTDKENFVMVSEGYSEVLKGNPDKPETVEKPDFMKLEEIRLTDIVYPDDYYAKKWEEELVYFSKYGTYKDYDFYANYISEDGGPSQRTLSFTEAGLFRRAKKRILQINYEDRAADGRKQENSTQVKVKLYLGYDRCYTYTIDLSKQFYVPVTEILESTGLLETGEYKDIIGVVLEYPDEDEPETSRTVTGYEFRKLGWLYNGGDVYYIKNDLTPATGLHIIGEEAYMFGDDGIRSGKYTGWSIDGGEHYYWNNGVLTANSTFTDGGVLYYADEKGAVLPASVITTQTPDGKTYTSYDGGKTWRVGNKKSKAPAVYFKYGGKLPVNMSDGMKLMLHNETGAKMTYSEDIDVNVLKNGRWTTEFKDKGFKPASAILDTDTSEEKTPFALNFGIYEPINGRYRYRNTYFARSKDGKGYDKYVCTIEFSAVNGLTNG